MRTVGSATGTGWRLDWWPGRVRVEFCDGTRTLLDYGNMPPDQADWYRGIAHLCGYDDPFRYAVHHDLAHCWLSQRLWGVPSPTLWAVAHDLPDPAINGSEEYLVNTAQWTLATGNREWHAEYLRQIVGDGWRETLDALEGEFNRVD